MAAASLKLLTDAELHTRMSLAARSRAVEHFSEKEVVPLYTRAYERALARSASASSAAESAGVAVASGK